VSSLGGCVLPSLFVALRTHFIGVQITELEERGKAFELLSGLLQSGVIHPVLDTPYDAFIGEDFFLRLPSPVVTTKRISDGYCSFYCFSE
jgi:hypothetical protein